MQSQELLLAANERCFLLVAPLLEDLASAPLQTTGAAAGNHAHWLLGHLLTSEGSFRAMMEGTPHPFADLQPLFSGKSTPRPDGAGYPPYAQLLDQLKERHAATLKLIRGLSESDLDQPSQAVPPGFEPFFGTWRVVLLMRPLHWMNHRGQLADCRRAAGRPPLMA